jgi:argininosuccinate lyase
MLHGGRLGNIREDVAKFCSSRKDDEHLAEAVLAINKAHVVMLIQQKIIQSRDGVEILLALSKIDSKTLDPHSEDIHMAVEEVVIDNTGPEIGGNLHIAKSRNDQVTTAIRIALRIELINIMQQILEMQKSLLKTAEKHLHTMIIEYTHLQPAQPVTFAHYLLSHVESLSRDLERLKSVYSRVNFCPLGAGALATTSFPISRTTTAKLLGFDEILENSIDAVGSRDFIIETQAALALLSVNLSRLAEDFIIWSSPEFGTIELPDEFTSTSSIMPQKKNPEVLEVIRARASYALGDFVASIAIIKSLPTTYNLDFQEITPRLWASTDNLSTSLSILTKLIPDIKISNNIESKATANFVGATELANMLVQKYNIAFRTSHKVVGALVRALIDSNKTLLDTSPEFLQKVAMDSAGIKVFVKKQDLFECTNPRKLVETYKVLGGPSPKEVHRAIESKNKIIANMQLNIKELHQNLENAKFELNEIIKNYILSKNDKLKNPN